MTNTATERIPGSVTCTNCLNAPALSTCAASKLSINRLECGEKVNHIEADGYPQRGQHQSRHNQFWITQPLGIDSRANERVQHPIEQAKLGNENDGEQHGHKDLTHQMG